jgi:hypothetical protein
LYQAVLDGRVDIKRLNDNDLQSLRSYRQAQLKSTTNNVSAPSTQTQQPAQAQVQPQQTAQQPQPGIFKRILQEGVQIGGGLRSGVQDEQQRGDRGESLWSLEGLKKSKEAFKRGYAAPEQAPTGEDLLKGWGWDKSPGPELPVVGTPRNIAGAMLEANTDPVNAIASILAGMGAASLLPKAKTVVQGTLAGATQGAVEGGVSTGMDAYAKDQAILPAIATGIVGGTVLGGTMGAAERGISKAIGKTKPRQAEPIPESVAEPFKTEPRPTDFTVEPTGRTHVGEPKAEISGPQIAGYFPTPMEQIAKTLPQNKMLPGETPKGLPPAYPKEVKTDFVAEPDGSIHVGEKPTMQLPPGPYERMLNDIIPDVQAEISKVYVPGAKPSIQQFERFVRDAAIAKGYDYDALAKQAGIKPVEPQKMTVVEGKVITPEEKQLNLLDKEIRDANNYLGGVRKEVTQAAKAAQKEGDIFGYVKSRGGIKPSPSVSGEYNESIPLALKNKNGMALDELAAEMGMDSRQLLDALNSPRSNAFDPDLAVMRDTQTQAIQKTVDALQSDKGQLVEQMNQPRVKKAEPEQYTVGQKLNTKPYGEVEVAEVGDMLVKLKNKSGETKSVSKRALRSLLTKEQPVVNASSKEYNIPKEKEVIKENEGIYSGKEGEVKGNNNVPAAEQPGMDNTAQLGQTTQAGAKGVTVKKGIGQKVSEIRALAKSGKLTMDEAYKFNASNDITDPTKRLIINDINEAMKKGLHLPDSQVSFEQWHYRKYGQEPPSDRAFLYDQNYLKKEQRKYDAFIKKAGTVETLDQMESDVKASIKSKMSRITSGIDPTLMADLTKYGAIKIAKGSIKFGQWASEMTKEFGAKIAPHLRSIYAQAKELHSRFANGDPEAVKMMNEVAAVKVEPKAKAGQATTSSANVSTPQQKVQIPYKGPLPDTKDAIKSKTERTAKIDIDYVKVKAEKEMVDNLNMLRIFDEHSMNASGKNLPEKDRAYILALNTRNADVQSSFILEKGLIDSQGNEIGEGLKQVLEQVPKKLVPEFKDYLVHSHAPYWLEQGRKVFADKYGITPDAQGADISRAVAKKYEQKYPEFKKIADRIYDFQRKLDKAWLVDTGIISEKMFNDMTQKYPNYIPFNRIIEQSTIFSALKKGFVNKRNPIKEATGSERPIIDPVESIIEHIDLYVKTAKYNEVGQSVVKQLRENPEALQGFAEIADNQSNMNFKSVKEINKILSEEGIDGFVEKYAQQFDEMFNAEKKVRTKPGETYVTVLENGEPISIKINEPMFLEALTKLGPKGQKTLLDAVGRVTRTVKTLTTGINPIFGLLRNIWRDIPTAFMYSKTTNNPVRFSVDLLHSMVSVLAESTADTRLAQKLPDFSQSWLRSMGKLYRSYQASGGGHSSSISADRNMLAASKRKVMGLDLDIGKPVESVKAIGNRTVDFFEAINNAVESGPRLGEYKRIDKGDYNSKVKGIYEAGDVTVNFKKYGDMIKQADNVVLYLNAATQGLTKIAKEFKSNPYRKATIMKGALAVTVPTVLFYVWNHDNPNYKKLGNYIKDNYFLIPKPDGTFIKIPKSREVGVVFGSTVERMLRYWNEDDPEAFKAFAETIKTNFMPPTRSIFAPLMDVRANKDYVDRPIVPGYLEDVSPELQYDSKTSEVSKFLGETFKMSPKQIEYLIRSYTGVVGQVGLPATTEGASVGSMLERQVTADPLYSNDVISDFYDTKEKLDTAYNNFRTMRVKNEDYSPAMRKAFTDAANKISTVRKQIRNIEKSGLSPDGKEKKIRPLQNLMLKIAENANKVAKKYKGR